MKYRKPKLDSLSIDELTQFIYRPFTFCGKSTFNSRNGQVTTTQLLHQIERCHVDDLVRIVYGQGKWKLENDGLDDPNYRFWFLIEGGDPEEQRICFIVNEDYLFYPIWDRRTIMPESNADRNIKYSLFSEVDRLLTAEAIETYLRLNSW